MNLYISTGCLKNGKDVKGVLDVYAKAGIRNIELGSSLRYIEDGAKGIKKYKQEYDMNFIVHHYFPPPRDPFIINLASQDAVILRKSIEQVKNSIKFCSDLRIRLFSFHAGFRIDPDKALQSPRGFRFEKDNAVVSYDEAFQTFVRSVEGINNYAVEKGVKLAVENNVLSEYNLVNGENRFLLGCEWKEFEQIFDRISSDNVGLLLDLGHLKVTSRSLKFDRYEFIDRLKDKVFLIHIHENNGKVDEHKSLYPGSWCLDVIAEDYFRSVAVVLESINLGLEEIAANKKLLEDFTHRSESGCG